MILPPRWPPCAPVWEWPPCPAPTPPPTPDELGDILGPFMFAEYRAADRNNPSAVNPRISVAPGGGVDLWPEEYGRNAPLSQFTAEILRQPALAANTFNARPGITFNGTSHYLANGLSPVVASGSRMYWWMTWGWTGAPAALATPLEIGSNASTRVLIMSITGADYGPFQSLEGTDDDLRGQYPILGDVGARHLLQGGTLPVIANKFARDGVFVNGQGTGVFTAGLGINQVFMGGGITAPPGFRFAPIVVQQLVLAHDPANPTALPTAQQIADVSAILTARGGL